MREDKPTNKEPRFKPWTELTEEDWKRLKERCPGEPWDISLSIDRKPDAGRQVKGLKIWRGFNFGKRVFWISISRTEPAENERESFMVEESIMLTEAEAASLERWLKAMHPNPNKE